MKPKTQKSIDNKVALSPKLSSSGISIQKNAVAVILSGTDVESQYKESELCCVCHKFSPPNMRGRPYLKIVNLALCDKSEHLLHLSFCTTQFVLRINDICPAYTVTSTNFTPKCTYVIFSKVILQ